MKNCWGNVGFNHGNEKATKREEEKRETIQRLLYIYIYTHISKDWTLGNKKTSTALAFGAILQCWASTQQYTLFNHGRFVSQVPVLCNVYSVSDQRSNPTICHRFGRAPICQTWQTWSNQDPSPILWLAASPLTLYSLLPSGFNGFSASRGGFKVVVFMQSLPLKFYLQYTLSDKSSSRTIAHLLAKFSPSPALKALLPSPLPLQDSSSML